ncbi:MAG: hydroxymethylglutaryl-CoA lyase [Peptococcaceae bacterium BICA1-7]|nr:MAG: hydroxymethylglutaryl-CoA lyase [Peptococcaceae bacterium BICA1-7]HBV95481.1 hydroxymethylglutaryl-CoA lyase [Desulfotomaculum sp.]
MKLPRKVSIVEVGPRDGLQNEPIFMSTDLKIDLVNCLIRSGLKRIEATSFVHPRWIPQLKDAEEVIKGVGTGLHTRISALIPNLRGYERARECGVREINLVISASQSHNMKNVNRTIEESLKYFGSIAEAAQRDGVMVRGSVAVSFGCPYEGKVPPDRVYHIASELKNMGCFEIVLADTVGVANPAQVYRLFGEAGRKVSGVGLAAHFHDTRGLGLANVLAAMQAGVTVFDSSIGGMGGCPYAPGAPGNIATEKLVMMLSEMKIETGIDTCKMTACLDMLRSIVGTGKTGGEIFCG